MFVRICELAVRNNCPSCVSSMYLGGFRSGAGGIWRGPWKKMALKGEGSQEILGLKEGGLQ